MELNEKTLPLAVREDIEALKAYHKGDTSVVWEALWYRLYSTINSFQHNYDITEEMADYLRTKYLGLGSAENFYFNDTKNSIYVK